MSKVAFLLFIIILAASGYAAYILQKKVDCIVSQWSTWSVCDVSSGNITRTKNIITEPRNKGLSCPILIDTSTCIVDCKVSDWEPWSACNDIDGYLTRSRTIIDQPKNGGSECPPLNDTSACSVDCKTSNWSPWSCTTGVKVRSRSLIKDAINGGSCGILRESLPCNFTIRHPTTNKPWVYKNAGINFVNSNGKIGINQPLTRELIYTVRPITNLINSYFLVNAVTPTEVIRYAYNTMWNVPSPSQDASLNTLTSYIWQFEKQLDGLYKIRSDFKPNPTELNWVVGWDSNLDEIKIVPDDGTPYINVFWKIEDLHLN